MSNLRRYSSRRTPLDRSFLTDKLKGAITYDRIAGYFSSSLLELAGETLDTVTGKIRVVCNSHLDPRDVQTAKAAKTAIRREWTTTHPETLLDGSEERLTRQRFQKLYNLLLSEKLQVRVLPDEIFGLIHGKAGIITFHNGSRTCFMGSANETQHGWRLNYELIWEDDSAEAVAWVQEEFDALWFHPSAVPLAEAVIQDLGRLAHREVIANVEEWQQSQTENNTPDPAAVVVESPIYREEFGLWPHQKYFISTVFRDHCGPRPSARYLLADQVGLGKTVQLAVSAHLIALMGTKPILILCPKSLVWQWQTEMKDLLGMASAVWDGGRWVDENNVKFPIMGAEGILKCPRRIGIVSTGLISHGSEIATLLKNINYDLVILDEAHRARRRNLGIGREHEKPSPNNLLQFMWEISEKSRSVLLATATPVQLYPIEAWDLLDILSRGEKSDVLGSQYSYWRRQAKKALSLIMQHESPPTELSDLWEWVRNPLPPRQEHTDFAILRDRLRIPDEMSVVDGGKLARLTVSDRNRLERIGKRFFQEHHPFIRRIIRRTREQLENDRDPETNEPLLAPIKVTLYGEHEREAITLPAHMREAYKIAEDFCAEIGNRMQGSGFLKTLLLRRMGSSIYAGQMTAKALLGTWREIEDYDDEDETTIAQNSQTLTPGERELLNEFLQNLDANQSNDPKYEVVQSLLSNGWLDRGCIIFSQYRDSIDWLAQQLTRDFPDEPIGLYSGATASGVWESGKYTPYPRERLKQLVREGKLRLLLGTDAASEGLNLQRLGTLINLDLPWNPTRLEQRKGRIQRIGQRFDTIFIYNMRYKDSVEDRVHQVLSQRLQSIHTLFGQIPDVLEDVWVKVALGELQEAKRIIDAVPQKHPFELRYTKVQNQNWESCSKVLVVSEKERVLQQGW